MKSSVVPQQPSRLRDRRRNDDDDDDDGTSTKNQLLLFLRLKKSETCSKDFHFKKEKQKGSFFSPDFFLNGIQFQSLRLRQK